MYFVPNAEWQCICRHTTVSNGRWLRRYAQPQRRAEARGRVGPTPDDLGSKIKIGGGGDGGMGRSGCAVIEKTLRMPYDGSAVGTPSTNGTKACCLLPTPQREKKRELTR